MRVNFGSGTLAEAVAQGGFSDTDLFPTGDRARAMARRLVRYIADVSRVRALVMNEYGRAPSRDAIAALRAEHERRLAMLRAAVGEPIAPFRRQGEPVRRIAGVRIRLPEDAASKNGAARDGAAGKALSPLATGAMVAAGWLDLAHAVAARHRLTVADLTGPGREKRLVRVRTLLCALLVARGASRAQVGRWLGGRDHSTICAALHNWETRDRHAPDLAESWAVLNGGAGLVGGATPAEGAA